MRIRSFLRIASVVLPVFAAWALAGCAVNIDAFRDYDDPLRETVLSGEADEKILVLPIRGVIGLNNDEGLASRAPSVVQDVTAMLRKAEADTDVRALLIQVDSPGGTVVASDILYGEIMRYRQRTGVAAVTLMMTVAASGGYEASLAGDYIVAHQSTVTGSIGTVFIRPDVAGLLEKIGVGAEVTKSGRFKDSGSPLRNSTSEEREIFQGMIDDMNGRFLALVTERRGLDREALNKVADARVYTASQAKTLGLVYALGQAPEALAELRRRAGLSDDAQVVVYRRRSYADDTLYNPATASAQGSTPRIDLGFSRFLAVPRTGFYYLWAPEYGH